MASYFFTLPKAQGVEVRPWLQLPEMGIWVNEDNAGAIAEYALRYLAWASDIGLRPKCIIFDLEPSLEYAEELRATIDSGGLFAVIALLLGHRDAGRFAEAQKVLRNLVDQLHAHDVRAMAVVLPWIVDDLRDRDTDLQDMFDTPLSGIAWDQVSAIVYRPTFSDMFGLSLSPGYVARYAESMRLHFGNRAQLAIGNIGTSGLLVAPGYRNPAQIGQDVAAARSAGIKSISLYSLDGMVTTGAPDIWLATAASPTAFGLYFDPMTGLIRGAFGVLDQAVDERALGMYYATLGER